MPNDEQRGFTGYFMPVELIDDERLTWTDCALVAEIHALSKGRDGCRAGNHHFAKHLGISVGQVANLITKLRKIGYIKTVKFDGRVRWMEATLYPPELSVLTEGSIQVELKADEGVSHSEKRTLKDKGKGKGILVFGDETLQREWNSFEEHRRQLHCPLTQIARGRLVAKLNAMGTPKAIASLRQSMENGWRGVFEPKGFKPKPPPMKNRNWKINELNQRKAQLMRMKRTEDVDRELVKIDHQLMQL